MRRRSRVLLLLINVAAAVFFLRGGNALGWLFVASGVLLVYGYFRYGAVNAAFRAVRNGQLAAARQALAESPTRYLDARSQAYAHWVRAALHEADGALDAALDSLAGANAPALSSNDRAVICVIRAAIHHKREEPEDARAALAEAKAFEPTGKAASIVQRAEGDLR